MRIANILNNSYSATVELLWDSTDSEVNNNITYYTISISANGETWISTATMQDQNKSITLSYNTNYTVDVVATNCAGDSGLLNSLNILIGTTLIIVNIMHDDCTHYRACIS